MFNENGECRRIVVPGELVVLDRSHRANGLLPDLEIHKSPDAGQRKGLVLTWLSESRMVKAVLVAFALGVWAMWTAITLMMITN